MNDTEPFGPAYLRTLNAVQDDHNLNYLEQLAKDFEDDEDQPAEIHEAETKRSSPKAIEAGDATVPSGPSDTTGFIDTEAPQAEFQPDGEEQVQTSNDLSFVVEEDRREAPSMVVPDEDGYQREDQPVPQQDQNAFDVTAKQSELALKRELHRLEQESQSPGEFGADGAVDHGHQPDMVEQKLNFMRGMAKQSDEALIAHGLHGGLYAAQAAYQIVSYPDETAIQLWNGAADSINKVARDIDQQIYKSVGVRPVGGGASAIYNVLGRLAGFTGQDEAADYFAFLEHEYDPVPMLAAVADQPGEQVARLAGFLYFELRRTKQTLGKIKDLRNKRLTTEQKKELALAIKMLVGHSVNMKRLKKAITKFAPDLGVLLDKSVNKAEKLASTHRIGNKLASAKEIESLWGVVVKLYEAFADNAPLDRFIHTIHTRAAKRRYNPGAQLGEHSEHLVSLSNPLRDESIDLSLDFSLLVAPSLEQLDNALDLARYHSKTKTRDEHGISDNVLRFYEKPSSYLGRTITGPLVRYVLNDDDWRALSQLNQHRMKLAGLLSVSEAQLSSRRENEDMDFHTLAGAIALLESIDRQILSLSTSGHEDATVAAFALRRAMAVGAAFRANFLGDDAEARKAMNGFVILSEGDQDGSREMHEMIASTGGLDIVLLIARRLNLLRTAEQRLAFVGSAAHAVSARQVEQAFQLAFNAPSQTLSNRPFGQAVYSSQIFVETPSSTGRRSRGEQSSPHAVPALVYGLRDWLKSVFFYENQASWAKPDLGDGSDNEVLRKKVGQSQGWFGTLFRAMRVHNVAGQDQMTQALWAAAEKAGLVALANQHSAAGETPADRQALFYDFLRAPSQADLNQARRDGLDLLLLSDDALDDAFEQMGWGGFGASVIAPAFKATLQSLNQDAGGKGLRQSDQAKIDHGTDVMGAAAVAAIVSLMEDGLIAGAQPDNKFARKAWADQSRREYSLKLGSTWIGLETMGALGVLMRRVVRFAELSAHIDQAKRDEHAARLVKAFAAYFGQRRPVLVFGRIISAAWNGLPGSRISDQSAEDFAQTVAQSVPRNSLHDGLDRDLLRSQSELKEEWESRHHSINLLGDEVSLPPGISADQMPAFYTDQEKPDALYLELARLDIQPAMPTAIAGDVELAGDEYRDMVTEIAQTLKPKLLALLKEPSYRHVTTTDAERRRRLIEVIDKTRAAIVYDYDLIFRERYPRAVPAADTGGQAFSPNAAQGEKLLATLSQQFGQS